VSSNCGGHRIPKAFHYLFTVLFFKHQVVKKMDLDMTGWDNIPSPVSVPFINWSGKFHKSEI